MKLFEQIGQATGKVTGGVIGGMIKVAASLTKNDDLREIGESAKMGNEANGKFLGQTVDGVIEAATGIFTQDGKQLAQGKADLKASSNYVAENVVGAAVFIGDQVVDTVDGVIERNPQKLKQVAKKTTKAVLTSLVTL